MHMNMVICIEILFVINLALVFMIHLNIIGVLGTLHIIWWLRDTFRIGARGLLKLAN